MSRYRKTMRQAIEEGLSNMQIAILKKEYAPFKGKTISAARAKQLMNILDKFKEADLKKLGKENIPFVSSGSRSKLAVRNMKFKVTTINPFKEEVTQEDFDLEEGKMSQIDAMQKDGKSAAEIAKLMKLDVKTVKAILGEEEIHEFKKMTVTINPPLARDQAIRRLKKVGLKVKDDGSKTFKVDGNGADLNKYAIDLKNFYKADIRAESYTIDESADEDNYNPITEACWVGYKKVGMKKKGDKMVPNCVPESIEEDKKKMKKADVAPDGDAEHAEKKNIKEQDDPKKLENELKQKENEIAQLKQKAETDKAKTAKTATDKMVNPETGEPLLQVGIAYKHLKDKMAKEKAAEAKLQDKKAEEEKKNKIKFNDIKRKVMSGVKEETLEESDASDKAKGMGLSYMKFGRYGKDGKVTHKSIGGNLTAVDKDEKPIDKPADKTPKNDPAVDNPKVDVKPAIDPQETQNDLEGMVTDGIIDVEDDGQGGIDMVKEYEPSQDYEAEKDLEAIVGYLKKKGINSKDISADIENESEGYISISVSVKGKPVKEDADYLMPKMNTSQLANIKNVWKHKTKKDVTPAVQKMIKNMDIPTQLAIKHAKINVLSDLVEMAKNKAYAIGMATAKKKYNDEPPLDKKTIKKAHEIGDKLSKMKKENKDHPAREIYEQIKGLKNKAEKSGMPYGILKKVYDRGMAAWRGGHRPGTSQQQWAFARVNSFVTKSSGTWGGADKDLAKQVKGS